MEGRDLKTRAQHTSQKLLLEVLVEFHVQAFADFLQSSGALRCQNALDLRYRKGHSSSTLRMELMQGMLLRQPMAAMGIPLI